MPKFRNIIIFVTIAAVFALIYVFYIKSSSTDENLVSSAPIVLPDINNVGVVAPENNTNTTFVTEDFLNLLNSVTVIKLNDSIFKDPAWNTLHDSTITLTLNPLEQGRPNPFAQFGDDAVPTPPALPQQGADGGPSNFPPSFFPPASNPGTN